MLQTTAGHGVKVKNGVARKAKAAADPRQARIENAVEVSSGAEAGDGEGVLGWAGGADAVPPALAAQEAATQQQRRGDLPDQWGQRELHRGDHRRKEPLPGSPTDLCQQLTSE